MTKIGNFDAITGENIIVEIDDSEFEKMNAQSILEEKQRLLEKAAREADKAALLAKMGLTADEAKLLLS